MKANLIKLPAPLTIDGSTKLAIASVVDGLLGLSFTLAFARILGAAEYGSLAALVSIFLTVFMIGFALQVTIARVASGELATQFAASAEKWNRILIAAAIICAGLCWLARRELARAFGVDAYWGASLIIPAAILDVAVAVQRGVILARGAYGAAALSIVTPPAGWIVFGTAMALAGQGVDGVVVGIVAAELLALAMLRLQVSRLNVAGPPLAGVPFRKLMREAWGPLTALVLFAALQNLDVLAVRRSIADDALASSYAAAAVAAKSILWIAVGVGLYLVPEAARRRAEGRSSHAVLGKCYILLGCAAAPMIAIFYFAGEDILRLVFGADLTGARSSLAMLSIAMSLLASAYLSLQLLLAYRLHSFLALLAIAAVSQPVLIEMSAPDLHTIVTSITLISFIVALVLGAIAVYTARDAAV
jgi:O-antigen/teichoic acid export membrane protein